MTKTNLTSWKGIQKGTKFRVVRNSNGHSYPTGRVLTLSRDGEAASSMSNCAKEIMGNNLNVVDIELIYMTISDMKLERDRILSKQKDELNKLEHAIEFCEKHGIEQYEDRFVESYHILKIAQDSSKTEIEKVKSIVEIMSK